MVRGKAAVNKKRRDNIKKALSEVSSQLKEKQIKPAQCEENEPVRCDQRSQITTHDKELKTRRPSAHFKIKTRQRSAITNSRRANRKKARHCSGCSQVGLVMSYVLNVVENEGQLGLFCFVCFFIMCCDTLFQSSDALREKADWPKLLRLLGIKQSHLIVQSGEKTRGSPLCLTTFSHRSTLCFLHNSL